MENKIVCPNCKKTISNNAVVEDASKGAGADTQFVICECGERITYWQITSQLRDQKPGGLKTRFQNWLRDLFPNRK
jgi:RNase P subunit RPR2